MERSDKPHVELYTDGACSGNPGPGGWAFILKHPATGKVLEQAGAEATVNLDCAADDSVRECVSDFFRRRVICSA